MTRQSIEDPAGLVVSTATSMWVPAAPSHVFDFLRDEHHRSKWDILSSGASMLEKAHIAKGPNLGNVVSLLTVSDTLKSPPAENKAMKRDTLYGIGVTTIFYISVGCMGYAAFGNAAPGNVLTGFDEPFWLVDIANIEVVIHLIRAYQAADGVLYSDSVHGSRKYQDRAAKSVILQSLSIVAVLVSLAVAVRSVAVIAQRLKNVAIFKTMADIAQRLKHVAISAGPSALGNEEAGPALMFSQRQPDDSASLPGASAGSAGAHTNLSWRNACAPAFPPPSPYDFKLHLLRRRCYMAFV